MRFRQLSAAADIKLSIRKTLRAPTRAKGAMHKLELYTLTMTDGDQHTDISGTKEELMDLVKWMERTINVG